VANKDPTKAEDNKSLFFIIFPFVCCLLFIINNMNILI
jgi:hypothetical protein